MYTYPPHFEKSQFAPPSPIFCMQPCMYIYMYVQIFEAHNFLGLTEIVHS